MFKLQWWKQPMTRFHGACVMVTAIVSAFGMAQNAEQESKLHADQIVAGIEGNMKQVIGSLDRVIQLLEERPTATIDLHGQRQSMIVVTPVPPGAVDVQALAREALVKIQERENGETVGNEQRDALLHLGGPAGD